MGHYASDVDEKRRYDLFQASKARVAHLNRLNKAKTPKAGDAFGLNWMSDRYEEEKFKKGHQKPKGFVPTAEVHTFNEAPRSPDNINWRYTEVVTAIKNQGQCGSCWAFSATEAIESQMILGTGGKLAISLSPQQIASCAPSTGTYGCMGCNGGFTEGAYEYVKSAPGLANSFFIPYAQSLTESRATKACPTAKVQQISGEYAQLQGGYAQVTGYKYAVPPCTSGACTNQDLKGFATALEHHPLSICVNAGTWNDYTGGVMSSTACGSMGADYRDHCVMATGFNTTAPVPYWIVRNSWSSTWGEEGYVYLEMAENTCGLADDATIPEVKLDLAEDEANEAAVRREAMYQRATQGSDLATRAPESTGGTLKITWSDCGDSSTHAKVTGVKPDTITMGQSTKITGSGTVDEQVTGGSFEISAKAGPITQKYSGDLCQAKTFNLPLGLGSVKWDGMKCPVAKGSADVPMDIQLSGAIPAGLAKAKISATAKTSSGDKLLCLNINTAPADAVVV